MNAVEKHQMREEVQSLFAAAVGINELTALRAECIYVGTSFQFCVWSSKWAHRDTEPMFESSFDPHDSLGVGIFNFENEFKKAREARLAAWRILSAQFDSKQAV